MCSRCRLLSTSTIAAASRSRETIKAGTSVIPALTAACKRRCQLITSYSSVFSIGRTISGERIPCVCTLSIKVFISSSSLTLNGCPAKGCNFSAGIATGFFIVFFILSPSFFVSCTGFFLQLVLLL